MEKFTHMRLRKCGHFSGEVSILDGNIIGFPSGCVTTGLYIFMMTASQATDEEVNDWWYAWLAEKEKRELDSFMDDEDKPCELKEEHEPKKSNNNKGPRL